MQTLQLKLTVKNVSLKNIHRAAIEYIMCNGGNDVNGFVIENGDYTKMVFRIHGTHSVCQKNKHLKNLIKFEHFQTKNVSLRMPWRQSRTLFISSNS